MKPAFVVVYLCDNDFGYQLEEAVERVFMARGTGIDSVTFRNIVVRLTAALSFMRNPGIEQEKSVFDYLNESIAVDYCNEKPTFDHDGGSVAVDCNTGYIWRF